MHAKVMLHDRGLRVNPDALRVGTKGGRRASFGAWAGLVCSLLFAAPALAQVDLRVTTTDAPDPVQTSQQVEYAITVHNDSVQAGTGVAVDVFHSVALTPVAQATPGWSCSVSGSISCVAASSVAGLSAAPILRLRFTAPASPQQVQISVSASANETDPNSSNNTGVLQATQVVAGSADLTLAIAPSTSSATVGSPISFTANVSNAGPGNAAALQVTGTLNGSFTFSSFGVSPSWSCTQGNGAITCLYQGGSPTGTLASGLNAAPIVINGIAGPAAGSAQLNLAASSSVSDPTPANASSSITVTAGLPPAVDLVLSKSVIGVQPIGRGVPFTYRLSVANSSSSTQTASAIQLLDSLPAGVSLQSVTGAGWNCSGNVNCSYAPTLAIGQTSAPLDLLVVYNNPVPVNGAVVSNTASVSAAEPDPTPSNNQSTAIASLRGSADLGVQWTGPSSVIAGSTFNVDLSASNAGPDVAADVSVSATIASGFAIGVVNGGVGWSCLASGQSISCQRPSLPVGNGSVVSLSLTAPGSAGGPFNQTASISGSSFDPSGSNNSASLPVTVSAASVALSLLKTDSIDPVAANAEFEYVLTVSNGGAVSQTGVSITDSMPATVSYLGFTGTGWTCTGGSSAGSTVNCSLGTALAAGASSSVRLRARGEAAGVVSNSAQARSLQNSTGAQASQTTTISDSLALTLTKRARSASVALGSNALFDLTVGNSGQTDASNLLLVDSLPAGLEAVSAAGDGWSCAISGARIDCQSASLARGATSVVVVEARTRSVGSLTNRAEVSAGTITPVAASDTITVTAVAPAATADLSLDLSDSADPVAQGAELDYLARVRNLGPDAASGVRVAFALPAALQSLGSSSPGWSCQNSGAGIECTLAGALASGAESLLALRLRAVAAGNAVGTANVASSASDPSQSNNTDSETTNVQASTPLLADLQLSATAPPSAVAGGRVEVVATIFNLGPGPAAAVLLRTQLGGAWALDAGSGSGFTCTPTGANLECRGGALAANQSVELRLQGAVAATASTALTATLTASSVTGDPSASNNSTNVSIAVSGAAPNTADLSISKTDSADPVVYGERFSYTLTVRNLGPAAANAVVIRDPLPAGLAFVSAAGAGLVCTGGAAVECRAAAPLAAGQQLVALIAVDAPATAGSITNEASVESSTTDAVLANNRATQTTAVNTPEGSDAEDLLESTITNDDPIAGDAVDPVVDLCDGSSGNVSALCDALYADAASGSDADVNQALRSIYPEEVLSHHASLNQLSATQFSNIDARLAELRSGGGSGLSISGLNLTNGSQSIPLGLLQGLLQDEEPQIGGPGDLISPWGFFVNGSISWGDQNIDSSEREVVQDFDATGITAGFDYRRSTRWVLGGAVGYNKFESGLTDSGGLDTSGFTLTGYSAYYVSDNTYFDTRFSYGSVDLDQSRRLVINLTGYTLDDTLTSSTKADQLSFAASFGHHISRGAWTLTPNAFVRYMHSDVDGFAEEGSDLAVEYSDQTVKSTVFGVGLQVSRVFSLSNGVLVPQFDLVWNQETGNDDTEIDARYVLGDAGEFFSLRPETPDNSYGSVGVGLTYVLANGKQAYLQWRESIGLDGLDRSTVNLGARFEF
ncbi:MAG TPA: autotransporter domain-containing protein [Xanthomonadales bacterium]|nr:autotransporter domain-containing protein [Xanthomonadales bacterium]